MTDPTDRQTAEITSLARGQCLHSMTDRQTAEITSLTKGQCLHSIKAMSQSGHDQINADDARGNVQTLFVRTNQHFSNVLLLLVL